MATSKKSSRTPISTPPRVPELVDPVWMLKAIAAVIVLAAVCGYAAICGLFYKGQWQLVLSPSRNVSSTPASIGLPYEDVRFGSDSSGQPQLSGWWIPSDQAIETALVMHGSAGTMSDVLSQAHMLHDAGLNVLLFDYRGYGNSKGDHPTEQRMNEDSKSALSYLSNLRHIPMQETILFGEGVGAALATRLCGENSHLPALILENADGDFDTRVAKDSRSRMVPFHLLFNQHFPLADPLHSLATPKLLISYTNTGAPPVDFARAADPKMTVEVGSPTEAPAITSTLRRFLGSYVESSPFLLQPKTN